VRPRSASSGGSLVKRAIKGLLSNREHPVAQASFRALRSLYYLGWQVHCPCCDRRFRKFVPLDELGEPDLACPRCMNFARHRLVWLYLERRTNLFRDRLRFLYVAPTDPGYQDRLRPLPNLDYLSIDLEVPEAMERMDVIALDLPDDSFDAILCCHVLEHVPDDGAAMRELHRVMRPGGWAILQSPVDQARERTYEDPEIVSPEARMREFMHPDHVRIYGRDYVDRLAQAGFHVRREDFAGELTEREVARYGLRAVEPIHLCVKRG
jgi:SAM-dependent methyltransferase